MMWRVLVLLGGMGCAGSELPTDPPTDDSDVDTDTEPAVWAPPEGGRVTIESAGVTLSARYGPAPTQNAPALILMNAFWEGVDAEGDFPQDMLDRLSAEGWTWLVYEYRGTGLSEGELGRAGPIHVADLENWSRKVAEDGYPVQAIVDTWGPISTPFANNSPDTPGVPVPCSVTLGEAGLPEGLDFIRKTPEGVRRQFQYRPGGATEKNTDKTKEWDPGDWVYQTYTYTQYNKSMYWYEPQAIDDLIDFHRETFPRCQ